MIHPNPFFYIIQIKIHSSCEIEDFKWKMSKLIFASCVRYSDRAYYWVCVLLFIYMLSPIPVGRLQHPKRSVVEK